MDGVRMLWFSRRLGASPRMILLYSLTNDSKPVKIRIAAEAILFAILIYCQIGIVTILNDGFPLLNVVISFC